MARRKTAAQSKAPKARRTKRTRAAEDDRPAERDDAVRRRIIRAAAEIYRECGYERAGMAAIAQRLGMTAPALYWYFRSKEDILVAFLEHTIADLIEFVKSLVHATEPKQRLWEFMHAYALWQLQQQELSAAYERIYALGHLRNSLPERQRQRITSLEREFYEMCRDLVLQMQGSRADSGAPIAFALIGMVEHLISWYKPGGAMSVKELATLYADYAVAIATGTSDSGKAPREVA